MKNWHKVMECCDQSWNLYMSAFEFYKMCAFLADIQKFSISLESLHFPTFFVKMSQRQILSKEIVMGN